MIFNSGPRFTWIALAMVLGCSFASAQQVQRTPQTAPTVQKVPQQIAVRPARNPYPLTANQRNAINRQLSPAQKREVSRIAMDIENGRSTSLIQDRWASLLRDLQTASPGVDVQSLILFVMHESYRNQQEDLAEIARRVQYFNEKKKRLRAQIEEARAQKWQASQIASMEAVLATVGEDAELANIDLQNQLQKQQQTLQTMSNVSKMLHDTAMAVVRKIG